MITRRNVLAGLGAFAASAVALGGYAFGIEPRWRLRVQHYAVAPARWPKDFPLTLAVVADLHASEPTMGLSRIRDVVDRTNALGADIILLLGDYLAGHKSWRMPISTDAWARELARLSAPLGVHAVLGNHDWWDDRIAQRRGAGPTVAGQALIQQGIPVYENRAVLIQKGGRPFWLAGLGDQLALLRGRSSDGRVLIQGVDDLPLTLRHVTDDAPVVLMAHEPDIFPAVPDRVALTISGHTHGGQVRFLGYAPVPGTRLGRRYSYGHIVDEQRHLIVSGGLGCSIFPVRFGVPPEIVHITLGGPSR